MATIYDGNSNCLECGRLVAPTSGMRGADGESLFCCRKCLRSYYDSQPGLWEQELEFKRQMDEDYEQHLIEEEERERLQDVENKRLAEEQRLKLIQEKNDRIAQRNSHLALFVTLFIITFLVGNGWVWFAFILYCMYLLNKLVR
jgi:hypothetical protein